MKYRVWPLILLLVMFIHSTSALHYPIRSLRRANSIRGLFGVANFLRRSPVQETPLQHLTDALEKPGLSPGDNINVYLDHMSRVTLNDVGLSPLKPFSQQQCVTIRETQAYHIAAFLVPKGKCIPIHDHPNMSVCSKLLTGVLRVRSFTVLDKASAGHIRATLHEDVVRTAADAPWAVSASEGNFHEFTAVEDCVILDVLLPPYSYPARQCAFYAAKIEPAAAGNDAVPQWELERVPERLMYEKHGLPVAIPYRGYIPCARSVE